MRVKLNWVWPKFESNRIFWIGSNKKNRALLFALSEFPQPPHEFTELIL
jgi:hypothetical protein